MRILVLTNLYPPHGYGGYELSCRDVADRFAERGHEVLVLTSDHRRAGPEPVESTNVERTLPLAWDRVGPPPAWLRPARQRQAARAIAGAVARHRPDVISVWNMAGLPSPALRSFGDAAQVWVMADAWPERAVVGDPWLAPAIRHPRTARLLGLPTALPDPPPTATLCFCSAHLRDRVLASTGWSPARSVVTPLGVDPRDFPLVQAPPARSWSWRLVYVGRLDAGKGVDTLVRSLAHLPPAARLKIVGAGEPVHLRRLGALIADLGLAARVEITSLDRPQLAAAYDEADVCVFPSEWDEPFGIVPLEAMSRATPVVATGSGGSGEYLRDGDNSRLFAAGDERALAAALVALAGDPAERARLMAGGSRTAARLTVDRLADQLEEIHHRATAGACGT